ncbi:hypothetical protein DV096_08750 [Bradymonadaceae bacterium TMQ3]|uniref:SnoaL-like domain-containing protein n=1 Tax=Lujinxingia sediminis TaxID=2480984 RepID=A0ABY0CTU5_9DELT|nr:nuclear transport factor 2 family protein [Lujinxingia sediminis]RDV38872.1 hypothetical protein DV096_08750 [Bradymonadaceae bacterium TMQ3]RVU44106.1 hypothetical protein EA187_11185 [Lujinxingia sediminis]TXC76356.1 hypothetical protein FRC91_06325 [Bradymonadales bacterium TMQ1]
MLMPRGIARATMALMTLIFVTLSLGCASRYITPDALYADDPEFRIDAESEILDTTEAREVLDVLYRYRQAVVDKDYGTLNELVSDDFYANAGTTETTSDDYGRDELVSVLEMTAQHADRIQMAVVVKGLTVEGMRAHVDYEYDYAYQYNVGDMKSWDAGVDVNRLRLVREDDRWKIVSGL